MCTEMHSQYDAVLDVFRQHSASYFQVKGSSKSKQAFLLVLKNTFFMLCNCYSGGSYICSKIRCLASKVPLPLGCYLGRKLLSRLFKITCLPDC